ncbi:MAG: NUMOD3 domain-containing DNA-binding protein [Nitrosarchaeum sp.]|nr:NUMOD3 domain-containing DNA-binding protein [Nitrosarchaeum sp.]
MYERKCTHCGSVVQVESACATRVKCEACRIKMGLPPKGKRDYDTDDFVYCRICNEAQRRLQAHLKTHNLTADQYLVQYPDSPIEAKNTKIKRQKNDVTRQKMSESAKKSWLDEDVHKRRVEAIALNPSMKGKTLSEEHRQKIAESVSKTKQQFRYLTLERRQEKKMLKKQDLENFVICPLCLKETGDEVLSRIQLITLSHLKHHGYTYEMLFEEYPECVLSIEEIGHRHSESMMGQQHFNYGKQLSDETKLQISDSNKDYWENRHDKHCKECGRNLAFQSEKDICKECGRIEYGTNDTHDKVYCRICNLMKSDLSDHIKDCHKLSLDEYKTKYDVRVVVSQRIVDVISEGKIGIKLSDDQRLIFKQKMIEKANRMHKEKLQWDDNFDIEKYKEVVDRQHDLVDTDDVVYCRYCHKPFQKITQHIETHNLTSYMYRQLFPGAPFVAKKLIRETTKNWMDALFAKGIDIGNNWGYGGKRKDIGHYTRSMIESNFCRMLKINNIRYCYEPQKFYLDHEKYIVYIPDLLLLDDFFQWKANSFIELKKKAHDNDVEKVNVFLSQYSGHIVNIVEKYSHEWDQLRRMYKDKLPLWETADQNIRTHPEMYK